MTHTPIERDQDIPGGFHVFAGTRVPVRILMEHLEAGAGLDDFQMDYPTVSLVPGGGAAATRSEDAGVGWR